MYLVVLVLDQVTKLIVLNTLPVSGPNHYGIEVIPDFFRIVHVYNKGAAWSMLDGRQGLLILLALGALFALYRWRRAVGLDKPFVQYTLGAFAGGAVGNVIDRVAYGHVVDFIAIRIPIIDYNYPVFNVADMGITVGALLYCWHGFREKPAPKPVA